MKKLILILLLSIILVGGCNKVINNSKESINWGEIQGVVEFLSRPCDPDLQSPNSCNANFPDYNSVKIIIYNKNNTLIKEINLNKVSSSYYIYNTNLPQGDYIVDIKGVEGSWILQDIQPDKPNTIKKYLPKEVEIKTNETTILNIKFYQL